jgi:GT2 family glycosyltransferase
VAKQTKVAIGIIYGSFEPDFVFSLLALKSWDQQVDGYLDHAGWMIAQAGTNLPQQRNSVVRTFLEGDAEWLLFIDTDQRFRFDLVDVMLKSADPIERPILSALIMAEKWNPHHRIVPACIGFETLEPPTPREYSTIPPQQHWQVGAVGSGCVLLHRTVLQKIWDANRKDAQPWFKYVQWDYTDPETGEEVHDIMGEDYVFSLRAQAVGFPCYVDTTIEVGHIKKRTLTTRDFWPQVPPELVPTKNFVVIPVKDQLKMTKALLRQLHDQGEHDGILVLDNGSNPETVKWLGSQTFAKVMDCSGMGIHEMWNAGATWAMNRHHKANIAFLNNDIIIGDKFISTLAAGLRSDPHMVAICPNYDGRETAEPIVQLHGICADRYDGTGGLAGFAFMVKSEWFQEGWRFPEDCKWWFGDNDLVLSMDMAGAWYAMATETTVEHIEGGSKTGNWEDPKMQQQLARDKGAFMRRWAKLGVTVQ